MTAYDNFLVRERMLSKPFTYAMGFTTDQTTERAIIFGLFSNSYKNGMAYLTAVDAFELGLIVDNYNQHMAGLDAEEQNFIADIVSKRYVLNIEKFIHDNELVTKREQINVEDAEWDAKFASLEADRDAITTLEARLEAKEREIESRIKTLQAQIIIERVQFDLQELENTKKELEVSQAKNQLAKKDIEIALKDQSIIRKDIELSNKDNELAGKDIELSEKDLQLIKLDIEAAEEELKITEAQLTVSRVRLKIIEAGLRQLDYEKEAAGMGIQSVGYEKDIARTTLIEVEKTETQVDYTMAGIQSKEKDIQLVEADNDIEKIELQKKEVDLGYLDVNEKIARTDIDIANTAAKIAETPAIQAELDKTTAEYAGEVDKLAIPIAKKEIIDSQTTSVNAENDAEVNDVQPAHDDMQLDLKEKMVAELDFKKSSLDINKENAVVGFQEKVDSAQSHADIYANKVIGLKSLADSAVDNIEEAQKQSENILEAKVEAMRALFEAELTTTLQHYIGKS